MGRKCESMVTGAGGVNPFGPIAIREIRSSGWSQAGVRHVVEVTGGQSYLSDGLRSLLRACSHLSISITAKRIRG